MPVLGLIKSEYSFAMPLSFNSDLQGHAPLARWLGAKANERFNRLSPRQWCLLVFSVVASWSAAFVYLTFSPDNYLHLYQLAEHQAIPIWVEVGRPLMYWFYMAFFQGSLQPPLQLLLGLSSLAACCMEVSLLWRLKRQETLFLCMFVLSFPFLVNVFGFETGKFSIPLAFLLSLYGFRFCQIKRVSAKCLGIVVMALGISFYQNSINFLSVVVLTTLAFNALSCNDVNDRCAWLNFCVPRSIIAPYLQATIAGGALYFLLAEAVRKAVGAGFNPRYGEIRGFVDGADLLLQTREILAHYKYFLYLSHPLLTRWFSLALFFSYFILLLFCCAVVFKLRRAPARAMRGGMSMLFLALSHLAVWSTDYALPGSLLGSGYRHVYPVVFVFAAVALFALRLCWSGTLKLVWWSLMCLCLLSFAVTDQSWAFNTNRLFYFDRAQLIRLASRIEASEHYRADLPVSIIGLLPQDSRPPGLQPRGFDVYGSALEWPGIARFVLREQGFVNPAPRPGVQEEACKELASGMRDQVLALSKECAVINLSNVKVSWHL